MNDHIKEIVGRKIKGVVVKESSEESPRMQIFLIFSDGYYFEIYNSYGQLTWTKGLNRGGLQEVRDYLSDVCEIVLEECDESIC